LVVRSSDGWQAEFDDLEASVDADMDADLAVSRRASHQPRLARVSRRLCARLRMLRAHGCGQEEMRQAKLEEEDETESEYEDDEDDDMAPMPRGRGVPSPPPKPAPPAPCDPEKHGGKGGQPHELTCAPGLWRTGRRQPTECLRWAATANCTEDGERDKSKDLTCFDFVRGRTATRRTPPLARARARAHSRLDRRCPRRA
jgi:hypothetical protein